MGAAMTPSSPEQRSDIERVRQAALEPYTAAPQTTEEWLKALSLGADASVGTALDVLRQRIIGCAMPGENVPGVSGNIGPEGEAYNQGIFTALNVLDEFEKESRSC
jgi:hypothetical protein